MESELPSSPLEAVSSPLSIFPEGASAYDILSVVFTVIFILWAIYTVIAIYHWLRFGRNSWLAVPAIGVLCNRRVPITLWWNLN